MTIECRCPGCGGRFRAADEAAGRRVKCPQCATIILVPEAAAQPPSSSPAAKTPPAPPSFAAPDAPPRPAATAEPPWFVRTADDRQHGPMAKGQLDQLVAQGRLDAFCDVRRADWDEWRAIDEVYPSLAMEPDEDGIGVSAGRPARVRPCPDCGQTVSRRAVGCPHCGCPLTEEPPPLPSSVGPTCPREPPRDELGRFTSPDVEPVGAGRRFVRLLAILATTVVLLVAVVGAGIYLGVLIRDFLKPPAPPVVAPNPPAPVAPPIAPAVQPLTAEQVAQCKDEVAAALARQVDDANRAKHDVMTALPQLGDYAEALRMAQELADPRSKRSKEEDKPQPPKPKPEPYQSQFETLQRECRAYLDGHVRSPVESKEAIWSVGREWVKMRSPERQLLENLLQPDATTPQIP